MNAREPWATDSSLGERLSKALEVIVLKGGPIGAKIGVAYTSYLAPLMLQDFPDDLQEEAAILLNIGKGLPRLGPDKLIDWGSVGVREGREWRKVLLHIHSEWQVDMGRYTDY